MSKVKDLAPMKRPFMLCTPIVLLRRWARRVAELFGALISIGGVSNFVLIDYL
jgi:hypothetical protein